MRGASSDCARAAGGCAAGLHAALALALLSSAPAGRRWPPAAPPPRVPWPRAPGGVWRRQEWQQWVQWGGATGSGASDAGGQKRGGRGGGGDGAAWERRLEGRGPGRTRVRAATASWHSLMRPAWCFTSTSAEATWAGAPWVGRVTEGWAADQTRPLNAKPGKGAIFAPPPPPPTHSHATTTTPQKGGGRAETSQGSSPPGCPGASPQRRAPGAAESARAARAARPAPPGGRGCPASAAPPARERPPRRSGWPCFPCPAAPEARARVSQAGGGARRGGAASPP